MRFMLAVKPKGHEETTLDGARRAYHFINSAPLSDANFNLTVNFLEYWEYPTKGSTRHFQNLCSIFSMLMMLSLETTIFTDK